MKYYAPNLTAIIGPEIAAKLIGSAGSLHNLATMPSGNLKLVGKPKKNSEFALTGAGSRHIGHIKDCDIIQNAPKQYLQRIQRLVANKCSIAVKIDAQGSKKTDDSKGRALRTLIFDKIEQMQHKAQKKVKVLAAPKEVVKKQRGGARRKKIKDRYRVTELRKRSISYNLY